MHEPEGRSGNSPESLCQVMRELEAEDVAVLIEKLVQLSETSQKFFSTTDANNHTIANFLSQKLHGPIPQANSLPYTFRIEASSWHYVEFIASGASGMVAKFKLWGKEVCVKTIKSPGLSRKQFEKEAAILATVQHPNVVRMIGCAFLAKQKSGLLVMELMEHDLRTVIDNRCPNPGTGRSPFPLIVAIDIMFQIAEGMQYLREHKILHRGLKAKNILVNRCKRVRRSLSRKFRNLAPLLQPQDYYIAKLADFGIAKARQLSTNNVMTKMAGTTPWRAPEVFNEPDLETSHYYQWPADVYSFAMTCYEILTGKIPFDGVPNGKIFKSILANERLSLEGVFMSHVLKDLIERCWATDPKERPSWAEICRKLWQCRVKHWRSRVPLHGEHPPHPHRDTSI